MMHAADTVIVMHHHQLTEMTERVPHLTGENLLKYKLIHVQLTKKVPQYRYPLYFLRNWR